MLYIGGKTMFFFSIESVKDSWDIYEILATSILLLLSTIITFLGVYISYQVYKNQQRNEKNKVTTIAYQSIVTKYLIGNVEHKAIFGRNIRDDIDIQNLLASITEFRLRMSSLKFVDNDKNSEFLKLCEEVDKSVVNLGEIINNRDKYDLFDIKNDDLQISIKNLYKFSMELCYTV